MTTFNKEKYKFSPSLKFMEIKQKLKASFISLNVFFFFFFFFIFFYFFFFYERFGIERAFHCLICNTSHEVS